MNMPIRKSGVSLIAGCVISSASLALTAQDNQSADRTRDAQTDQARQTSDSEPDPYRYPDDAFISISGSVASVSPNQFRLDFGDGEITVEMDDGDRDAYAYALLEGDKVTVYGRVDDDFFETRSIEASSVYVENIGTMFYSSSIDEDDYDFVQQLPGISTLTLQGVVEEVSDDQFTLSVGDLRGIQVETGQMERSPVDDEGYPKLESGDVVSVTGEADYDFLEGGHLIADTVIKIHDGDNI